MKVIITKIGGKNQKNETDWLEFDKLDPISTNRNYILVKEGKMSIEELSDAEKECDYYEFYPVLFLGMASTKTTKNLLVAQFIGEYGGIDVAILGELPNNCYQEEKYHLIDYQSYQDICKITGETTLSLVQYFKHFYKQEEGMGLNSLMVYKGKELNYDQQTELWKSIPAV